MPTYVVWSQSGVVAPDDRSAIARALTEIHHEVALAPRYFVQVIFDDLAAGSHFIAGEPVERQLWVRADIRAGRTPEQKQEMLRRITQEIGAITGLEPDDVWVYISDIPGPSVAEFGRSLPEPGQEDAWFAELPAALQDRLTALS